MEQTPPGVLNNSWSFQLQLPLRPSPEGCLEFCAVAAARLLFPSYPLVEKAPWESMNSLFSREYPPCSTQLARPEWFWAVLRSWKNLIPFCQSQGDATNSQGSLFGEPLLNNCEELIALKSGRQHFPSCHLR